MSPCAGGSPFRDGFLGEPRVPRVYGDSDTKYEVSRDSESVGDAALAFKEDKKKEQKKCYDPLREELKILERRLGISRSSSRTKDARERRRRKLREELEADGFDLELQDVLDNILVSSS